MTVKRTFGRLYLGAAVLVLATCDDPTDSPAMGGYPPPTSVTAVPGPHSNQIRIRWASQVGPGSYRVYWSTSPNVAPGNGTAMFVTPNYQDPHGVSAIHTGAISGTTYYYVVTAALDDGAPEGPPSSVTSATASGDIGFFVYRPEPGEFVGDSLSFRVEVESRFTLQSVVATVGGQSASLTTYLGTNTWVGTIPLDAVPPGPATGTIAATDVYSTVTTGSFAFVHGNASSTLTIASPESLTVARPNVRLNVSCVAYDLKGCYDVAAYEISCINTQLARAPSAFDQTVSLAACDGKQALLQFNATDSTWHTTIKTRRVFVELSPNLTEVASVHGSILDVQPDRILVLTQTDSVSTGVSIHSRVSGTDAVVYNAPGHTVARGFLTPVGAMFLERTGSVGPTVLHEWQSGTLSDLGSATGLAVQGNYAAFTTGAGLIRRDVVAGTNTTVSAATGAFDVAANGDVVWQASDEVWRFRAGVTTQLTNDGSAFVDTSPKTDGINVAYLKRTSGAGFTAAVFDATGEHILTPVPLNNLSQPYRVANGWVAYTKPVAGAYQVWSRSPAGEERRVASFVAEEALDALGPNGEVTVVSTRRYLTVPNYSAAPRDVNSSLGSGFFQNGNLFVTIGRSLFQVNP